MADRTQIPRPSGLPRPASRLPVFSSTTVSSPNPSANAPPATLKTSRSTTLRDKPSRESLTGGSLRNPKLRSMPSQDRLGVASSLDIPKASRHLSPRTRAVSGEFAKPAPPRTTRASMGAPPLPSPRLANDPLNFKRPAAVSTLSRRTSAQYLPSRTHTAPTPQPFSTSPESNVLKHDSLIAPEPGTPKPRSSRLSLAERTVETLAQIPSSPAVKGKTMAFYDPEGAQNAQRPGSRTSSRPVSRVGSDQRRDYSSTRSGSRPPSRPLSSSSHDENVPNFRATFRSAIPSSFVPIEESLTPGRATPTRTLRGRASIGPGSTPSQQYDNRGGLRQLSQPPSGAATDKPVSKTPVVRQLKPRASIGGLTRKPSTAKLDDAAAPIASAAPKPARKAPAASSATSGASLAFKASTTSLTTASSPAVDPRQKSAASSQKSSAVLREQIARAKAARRLVPKQDQPEDQKSSSKTASSFSTGSSDYHATPVVPTDTTFDFGLEAFDGSHDSASRAKVVLARVATARMSGRLNIAALGLQEIPSEVMSMYDADAMGTFDGSWAETVDLTRFVAADNEIQNIDDAVFPDQSLEELAEIEDSRGNIFGGLDTLDLHGNKLIKLPMGLRRLLVLTSLNLSQNQLKNDALDVISQIVSLRELKLGGNQLNGQLSASFVSLANLEIADLHGNNISALPLDLSSMSKLRILNISENKFESLAFEPLSKLPLIELHVRKNKLSGVLIEDAVPAMPNLQILDASSNQITHIVSTDRTDALAMPSLQQLLVSMNRLQVLPDLESWSALMTIVCAENNIKAIPDGFTGLRHVRHADFASNDIRTIPSEIGRMDSLAMLRLSANPLRDKKFCTAATDDIKEALLARLEAESVAADSSGNGAQSLNPLADMARGEWGDELSEPVAGMSVNQRTQKSSAAAGRRSDQRDGVASDDDFTTPPTSLPQSPESVRSHKNANQPWTVKKGGVLDRSETESSLLHPVLSSRVAQEHTVYEIYLQKNLFTAIPDSLSFFAATLSIVSLSSNQLKGETYFGDAGTSDGLDLPALKELNLSSNHITGLGPLVKHLRAPALQKLDVSLNRVSTLPPDTQLRDAFPALTVLLAGNNHLAELHPENIKGMLIVDVSNNDIEHLNPRLGLLGGDGGLQRFEALGNRFRVPRFNILERGTEATLRWLRGRVPVAEMNVWRETNQRGQVDMDDDLD
ncbi:hypothetical protein SEPCBS119000_004056 [Sporothrix epigloea]|uniref:Leucine-rich repeat-containing protein 40 n=1 Tax=Sporothrix epigloea TaxID=1892477 RepID=A0ABP0DRB1_9PEZI